jgi:hypothetical protein
MAVAMIEFPMITDDELDALPDDPEAAFVQYEAILRERVREANSDRDNMTSDVERDYIAHVLAFVDTRSIPLKLPTNPPYDDQEFYTWYKNFTRAVDYYKARTRLEISARKKENVSVLALSPDFKTQIGGHLTAIRKIVSEADVSENKRDAIFRRINNLQEEVDRDRTRTEAALALWFDVTNAISKGAKNLDPAIKRVERIMRVLAEAKDENEQKALIAPQPKKRIAAPTTAPEPSSTEPRKKADSDEIPF